VQSVEPFLVMPVGDSAGVSGDCRATVAEGYITSASPDAVTFQSLIRVIPANSDPASCRWTMTSSAIVPVAGTDVAVNRVSGKRTAIVFLVIGVTFFAYVAYAMSQMEFDWGHSGDCAFC
jgi:hypothetical protein